MSSKRPATPRKGTPAVPAVPAAPAAPAVPTASSVAGRVSELTEQLVGVLSAIPDARERLLAIGSVRGALHEISPNKGQPVDFVRWVPVDRVRANAYNPNSVASVEMKLLYTSILHDGMTQPVVVMEDPADGMFEIIDGFHRYFVNRTQEDIRSRSNGLLPVVVLDKPLNDRMASTVRHNRARGKHSVAGMTNLVMRMLDNGWKDDEICNELGMQPEELLRLKHLTGFSKLFENVEYRKAWQAKTQLRAMAEYRRKEAGEDAG